MFTCEAITTTRSGGREKKARIENYDGGEMAVKEKKEKVWKVLRSEKDNSESKVVAVTTKEYGGSEYENHVYTRTNEYQKYI